MAVSFSIEAPLIATDANYPRSVAAADFDGDQDADLVVASVLDDKIAWYENLDGQGTYGASQVISTLAIEATSVHVADVDGDGDTDVLSTSSGGYDSDVSWYENIDGRGSFGPQRLISADVSLTLSVFAADLDGDGDLDVLSASREREEAGKVAWYENLDGVGTFGEQRVISEETDGATTVYASDLDGDGDLDVVAGSADDDTIRWFENTSGAGDFEPHVVSQTAVFVTAVLTVDLDDDGDDDIVATSRDDNTVSWFANRDGQGDFGPERIISIEEQGPNELFVADLDGDQRLDVVVASRNGDRVTWYRQLGVGTFDEPRVVSDQTNGASSVVAVDADNDGDLDVFSTSRFDNKVALYRNLDGQGTFGQQQVLNQTGLPGAQSTSAADLDDDGDLDVLASGFTDDSISWFENLDGNGVFGPQRIISQRVNGAETVISADLDGDGDRDVASASFMDNKIAWYENLDGQGNFGPQRVVTADAEGPDDVRAADLDQDGDLDLLSASRTDNKVAWYENVDGQGVFGAQKVISTTQIRPSVVRAADLDGDGDLDVLANGYGDYYDPGEASIAWYENRDGLGDFGEEQIITLDVHLPTAIDTADIDNDGDLDVVVTSGGDDKVIWYENLDGEGQFGDEVFIDDDAAGAFWVEAVDLDGDADADLVVGRFSDDVVGWYENTDGRGTFSDVQVIDDQAVGTTSVFAADLDSDGDPDVLASLSVLEQVVWYRNLGDGAGTRGDFNGDDTVDQFDIDLLCEEVLEGGQRTEFDLTGDGEVDLSDHQELVVNILQSGAGDANLDGIFNSQDFVQVFQRGQYEDGVVRNSGWADGDWNCDGEFGTSDMVVAFQTGDYTVAARPSTALAEVAAAILPTTGRFFVPSSVDEFRAFRPRSPAAGERLAVANKWLNLADPKNVASTDHADQRGPDSRYVQPGLATGPSPIGVIPRPSAASAFLSRADRESRVLKTAKDGPADALERPLSPVDLDEFWASWGL